MNRRDVLKGIAALVAAPVAVAKGAEDATRVWHSTYTAPVRRVYDPKARTAGFGTLCEMPEGTPIPYPEGTWDE